MMQIHFGSQDYPFIWLFPKNCKNEKKTIVREEFLPYCFFIFLDFYYYPGIACSLTVDSRALQDVNFTRAHSNVLEDVGECSRVCTKMSSC